MKLFLIYDLFIIVVKINTFKFEFQENTKDIQTAIGFKMTYTLVQREPGILSEGDDFPLLSHYPILNQQEAAKTFFATFEKDCGNNDICESELQVSASLNLPLGIFSLIFSTFNAISS